MKITKEKYAPKLHFKPPFGWLNDPNGLMYANDQWHLFYQYYPMSNVWGPMHWGHAVSDDLVEWDHCPIALAPDDTGYMFSGSGVTDKDNCSGLFDGPSPNNLVVFYTNSKPIEGGKDHQSQSLAYSHDGGLSWTKYEGNPIITNPGLTCYRDPKVIWLEDKQHWVLLITHGQSIGIYQSTNLISWQLVSEFGQEDGLHSRGPWECPDLFPLTTLDGITKWVLVVGIGDGCHAPGSGTQYFVGDFDGESFTNINAKEVVLYLDHGRDYYATQSWFNAPQEARVGISWMSNWRYARHTETSTFRSIMTLPKSYSLQTDNQGRFVVAQHFVPQIVEQFTSASVIPLEGLSSIQVSDNVYHVSATLCLSNDNLLECRLFGENTAQITFSYTDGQLTVTSYRDYQGQDDVMKQEFPHHYHFDTEVSGDRIDCQFIVDHGTVELLVDDGKISLSQLYFPDDLQGNIALLGKGWTDVTVASCSEIVKGE
jgi:fructan beta-fructosidase